MDMQTLSLTEEQRAIRQMVRDFVDRELRPFARESFMKSGPPGQHDPLPDELLRKIDAVGLRTLNVPEKYGGIRYDMQTLAIIEEELARSGITFGLSQNWKVAMLLEAIAPQHLQDEWFPRIMGDPTFLMANASTEPKGSSDRHLPYEGPEAALDTKAVLRDGYWVINGQKQFITNAASAELMVVHAGIDGDGGGRSGGFLVPRDTPGMTIQPTFGEIFLDDCRVPEDYLLVRDQATRQVTRRAYSNPGWVLLTAMVLGWGQEAYDETVEFCKSRFQGGRHIIRHQLVGAALAQMAIKLDSVRAYGHWAARAVDEGADNVDTLVVMAYVHAAETVFDVCRKGVELWGGMGTTPESGIQQHLQRATMGLHLNGTMDIQRLRVAQNLFPETVGAYAGP